jgi:hypothetical protein
MFRLYRDRVLGFKQNTPPGAWSTPHPASAFFWSGDGPVSHRPRASAAGRVRWSWAQSRSASAVMLLGRSANRRLWCTLVAVSFWRACPTMAGD